MLAQQGKEPSAGFTLAFQCLQSKSLSILVDERFLLTATCCEVQTLGGTVAAGCHAGAAVYEPMQVLALHPASALQHLEAQKPHKCKPLAMASLHAANFLESRSPLVGELVPIKGQVLSN